MDCGRLTTPSRSGQAEEGDRPFRWGSLASNTRADHLDGGRASGEPINSATDPRSPGRTRLQGWENGAPVSLGIRPAPAAAARPRSRCSWASPGPRAPCCPGTGAPSGRGRQTRCPAPATRDRGAARASPRPGPGGRRRAPRPDPRTVPFWGWFSSWTMKYVGLRAAGCVQRCGPGRRRATKKLLPVLYRSSGSAGRSTS
jgi:hypothetical protein